MSEPTGLICPSCKMPPIIAFPDQAFCGNERCKVFSWNPQLSIDANLDSMSTIDLGGLP